MRIGLGNAASAAGKQAEHIPALDGIRGLAVLMVVLQHYLLAQYDGKGWLIGLIGEIRLSLWIGVDLFFVLSGFLITGILLGSRSRAHYYRNFYIRRALRIFPLYYGVLLLLLLLTPLLRIDWRGATLPMLTYLQNFVSLPTVLTAPLVTIPIVHFWSLDVEEHFYLIWPWAVRSSGKKLVLLGTSVAVACLLLRIWFFSHGLSPTTIYTMTPFRIDSLIYGALAAILVREATPGTIHHVATWVFSASAAALGLLFVWERGLAWSHFIVCTFGASLLGLFFAALILLSLKEGSLWQWPFKRKWLRLLGTYSYGIYIIHYLIFGWVTHLRWDFARITHSKALGVILSMLIGVVVTFGLAAASYLFYESRWLRLKERFAPH